MNVWTQYVAHTCMCVMIQATYLNIYQLHYIRDITDGMVELYTVRESNMPELILRSLHLRIQSSHLIFTFFAGVYSSVLTC